MFKADEIHNESICEKDKITKESVIVAAMLFLLNFYLGHSMSVTL